MKKKYSFLIIFFLLFSFSYSQITSFPHSVSFENASDLGTTAANTSSKWTTATSGSTAYSSSFEGTITFARESNPADTPSSGTGPSSASDGSTWVIIESSGHAGEKAEMAAVYDFSGRTGAQITFDFHNYSSNGGAYGPATAALWVYNTETYAWKQNWVTTNNSSSWQSVSVDLSEYDDMIVELWFTATVVEWQSDFALDNIVVSSNAYSANSVTTYYVDDKQQQHH